MISHNKPYQIYNILTKKSRCPQGIAGIRTLLNFGTQEGNLTVTYGGVHVNLGKGDNIESRVAAIGKTLPSIAGLSGILHLENYDGTQNRFIFSKK